MKPYSYDQLEKYLDNELPAAERAAIHADLATNEGLKHELTAMIASAEAVRYYGIAGQVAAIQQQYLVSREHTAPAKQPAAIKRFLQPAMKIAASILFIAALLGIYKYSTVSPNRLMAQYYSPYELTRTRGNDNLSAIEKAYEAKDWNAVIALVNQQSQPDSKALFLAGSASLELKQPAQAADKFGAVIAHNVQTQGSDFQDEAEFYLAMSYIANNDAHKAVPILKKIRGDQSHLFHAKAEKISMLDLKILGWKK